MNDGVRGGKRVTGRKEQHPLKYGDLYIVIIIICVDCISAGLDRRRGANATGNVAAKMKTQHEILMS